MRALRQNFPSESPCRRQCCTPLPFSEFRRSFSQLPGCNSAIMILDARRPSSGLLTEGAFTETESLIVKEEYYEDGIFLSQCSGIQDHWDRVILYSVPDGNWVRAEERVLWYSAQYRDWDLSNGTTPREVGTPGLFQWRFAF